MMAWKKKLISFLLVFLLTAALLPATAFASDTVGGYCGNEGDGSNLSWSLDLDTGELTISGTGEMKSYGVTNSPWSSYADSIRTLTLKEGITSIGADAFQRCKFTGTLIIPDSVTDIGMFSFDGCTEITGLVLGKNVKTIGNMAFRDCKKLSGTLKLPDNLDTICQYAFNACENLTSIELGKKVRSIQRCAFSSCKNVNEVSVDSENQYYTVLNNMICTKNAVLVFCPIGVSGAIEIPNTITSIREYAFKDCKNITSIKIPGSVTKIQEGAFSGCSGLNGTLNIPYSVTSIASNAFYNCDNLESYSVNQLNNVYCSIDGLLLNKDGTELLDCPKGKQGECKIPDTVVTIKQSAFSGCEKIPGELVIPSSVVTIESYAFYHCAGLTGTLSLGKNVNSVKSSAFYGTSFNEARFKGNAPTEFNSSCGLDTKKVTIYYPEGKEGWTTPTWNGYTTVPYKVDEEEEPDVTTEVSLNCNGGICDKEKISVTVGQVYGALPTPSYPGHVFQGWYTQEEGGDKVTEKTMVTAKEAHTLYAHWTTETYQITYDANGGTGAPEAQEKSYGTNLILSKMVPTKDNYIFQGWAESKTATQAKYQPGAAYTEDRAATLYAVWQQSVPENTAVVSIENVTLKPGETAEVVASIQNNPGIAGYHFEVAADTNIFSVPTEEDELLIEKGDFTTKGSVLSNGTENGWEVLWYHTNNVKTDGGLFRMTLSVAENAEPGVYPITIKSIPEDIVDEKGNVISVTCVSGSITIANVVPGDVNGDGERTNLDEIYLARSLLGLVTLNDSQKSAADVNGDGIVSNADVIRLARVLIGLDQI